MENKLAILLYIYFRQLKKRKKIIEVKSNLLIFFIESVWLRLKNTD